MRIWKIVLADDHQIVLDGLQEILETVPDFHVTGQANNSRSLLTLLGEQHPDLVLLDLNMPGKDGLEALAEIRSRFPALKTLVLTMYDSPEIVARAFSEGADGYLLKEHGRDELLIAIREVLAGRTFLHQPVKTGIAEVKTKFPDEFRDKIALTEREIEILRLIAHSYTNKEIGDKLFISEFTVATHRRNLKRKLHAENTADLVRFAFDHQLM